MKNLHFKSFKLLEISIGLFINCRHRDDEYAFSNAINIISFVMQKLHIEFWVLRSIKLNQILDTRKTRVKGWKSGVCEIQQETELACNLDEQPSSNFAAKSEIATLRCGGLRLTWCSPKGVISLVFDYKNGKGQMEF